MVRRVFFLLAIIATTDAFSVVGGSNLSLARCNARSCRRNLSTKIFVGDVHRDTTQDNIASIDELPAEDRFGENNLEEGGSNANSILITSIIAIASIAVMSQTTTISIDSLQGSAMQISGDLWASYSRVLDSSPVQTKAVTSATVYTIGDIISQRTEGTSLKEVDKLRILRSTLAGLLGHGPLSHVWYNVSENLFQNILHLPDTMVGTAAKVIIDQTTWGPFWNNTYILMLGLMKLDALETIFGEMKRTTIPLIVSGLKLWPLAHCVTYGLVPVENRLLWVDFVEIAWVTILATTASQKDRDDDNKLQHRI